MTLWLPPSHTDHQRMKDVQLQAEFARLEAPDIGDAMECQRRLKGKDERLELCWGSAGPHAKKWVIVRNAEDGQRHVVKVFQTDTGDYLRPDPSTADRLMNLNGKMGEAFLRELQRELDKQEVDKQKYDEEFSAMFDERITSDLKHIHGIKDTILVSKDLK